jgi:NRPS condensation-like uncharacterized protein
MRSFLAYCCIISTLYAVRMGKRKFSQIADSQSKALDASYFEHHDVVELARSLIGKILHTQIGMFCACDTMVRGMMLLF